MKKNLLLFFNFDILRGIVEPAGHVTNYGHTSIARRNTTLTYQPTPPSLAVANVNFANPSVEYASVDTDDQELEADMG